jgi:allantoin racemase
MKMKIMAINVAPKEYTGMFTKEMEENERRILNSYAARSTEVVVEFPEDYGAGKMYLEHKRKGVPNELGYTLMAPGLVKKAIEAEDRGFDAVMTVCTYDFGAEAARHVVDIPVVATGAATCHVASLMVDRVGVLAPTTAGIPITYKVLRNNGLYGDRVAPIRGVDLPVQELWNCKDDLKKKIVSLFQKTVDEGAQICWIPGALLIPFALPAQEVQKELGVPVLDPIAIGVKMCELLVGIGYKNSRACYPFTCRPNPKDLL